MGRILFSTLKPNQYNCNCVCIYVCMYVCLFVCRYTLHLLEHGTKTKTTHTMRQTGQFFVVKKKSKSVLMQKKERTDTHIYFYSILRALVITHWNGLSILLLPINGRYKQITWWHFKSFLFSFLHYKYVKWLAKITRLHGLTKRMITHT